MRSQAIGKGLAKRAIDAEPDSTRQGMDNGVAIAAPGRHLEPSPDLNVIMPRPIR